MRSFKNLVFASLLAAGSLFAPIAPLATAQTFAPCDTRNGCTMQGYIYNVVGGVPAVTGTGTPTIATGSSNVDGVVTAGASATSVVITFNTAYAAIPFCTAASYTQLAAWAYTVSATAITITQTATSGNKIVYHCAPSQNGG